MGAKAQGTKRANGGEAADHNCPADGRIHGFSPGLGLSMSMHDMNARIHT